MSSSNNPVIAALKSDQLQLAEYVAKEIRKVILYTCIPLLYTIQSIQIVLQPLSVRVVCRVRALAILHVEHMAMLTPNSMCEAA